MTKEQIAELRETIADVGHFYDSESDAADVARACRRLLDEREALLEALLDAANHGSGDEVEDRAREAIKKAEAP